GCERGPARAVPHLWAGLSTELSTGLSTEWGKERRSVDNPSDVDAGVTEPPAIESVFTHALTCENTSQRQQAQMFPHTVHKIRHTLWTTSSDRLGPRPSGPPSLRPAQTLTRRVSGQSVLRSAGTFSPGS